MYEMIVDGQSLGDLIYITSVNRTAGPVVKNRSVEVNAYIVHDVLATIDVLNKLLTGEEQEFIFTDQIDRYWIGKVKENIKPSNSEQWAKITIEIEIPSGVSYATNPQDVDFKGLRSLMIENNGTDIVYPTFDFTLKADTYMIGIAAKDKVFQFGEPLEASPLKEVTITKETSTDGQQTRRRYEVINKKYKDLTSSTYDVSKINPGWKTYGSFIQRSTGMPTSQVGGKIKVGKWATHWQTGEKMANWVKGKTFLVDGVKSVKQSKSSKAYRLKNNGIYIGWILEQDIYGSVTSGMAANNNNAGDLICSFVNGQSGWHGPSKNIAIDVDCTDFEVTSYINYFVNNNDQYGAFYIGVMSGSQVICGTTFSTHKTNKSTSIYFDAYGKGLNGEYTGDVTKDFWGYISMVKEGNKFTFKVFNDIKKKTYTKSYTVADKGLKVDKVVIWAGKYGSNPPIYELSAVRLQFTALNGLVYVKPTTTTTNEIINLPDPKYKYKSGDVIRLDMATQKAYVNGIEFLSPIAYGSKPIGLKPGENELMLDVDSDIVPDVLVHFQEQFR